MNSVARSATSSRALAQGRQVDLEDVEPVVEVLAEDALFRHLHEVAVGGGDHAHVGLALLLAADAHVGERLEHAQQVDLRALVHGRDFVEEDGAAVGELELALLSVDGAGERAALVAEQLGGDELARDGAGVHGDERARAPAAAHVDGARHQLLARARLAGDEHGRVGLGRQLDLLEHVVHDARARHHALEVTSPDRPMASILLGR